MSFENSCKNVEISLVYKASIVISSMVFVGNSNRILKSKQWLKSESFVEWGDICLPLFGFWAVAEFVSWMSSNLTPTAKGAVQSEII